MQGKSRAGVLGLVMLSMVCSVARSQTFSPFQADLPSGAYSDGAWADYDKDGYMDIALTYLRPGKYINIHRSLPDTARVLLYRYNPASARFELSRVVDSTYGLHVAWGDWDRNSWPDLIYTTSNFGGLVTLNPGTGGNTTIRDQSIAPDYMMMDFKIADLNSDGVQDVITLGGSNAEGVWIEQNAVSNGYGYHIPVVDYQYGLIPLTGVDGFRTALAVGDLDNDGYPDIIESGVNYRLGAGTMTRVFQGKMVPQGQYNHVDLLYTAKANLAIFSAGSITLFDYDGDGDLDILTTGCDSSPGGYATRLYRNDRNFTFVEMTNTGLGNFGHSAADFADVNLDGKPDLVITGKTASGVKACVYLNQGPGAATLFSEIDPGSLAGVENGVVHFADFDHNGRADLMIAGHQANGLNAFSVYRNAAP